MTQAGKFKSPDGPTVEQSKHCVSPQPLAADPKRVRRRLHAPLPAESHEISIRREPPKHDGALVLLGGNRASCSCGWWSDCYAQFSDTERAIEVHLRRVSHCNEVHGQQMPAT